MTKKKPKFRSKFEAQTAEWLKNNKIDFQFEAIKIPYGSHVTNGLCEECGNRDVIQCRIYLPDFWLPDYQMFIECKGRLLSSDRKKMRDVKKHSPSKDIRLLFMANNKIDYRRPDRYSDWCEKNDYIYAIKELPKEWFKK